jgi:hypothetical protein
VWREVGGARGEARGRWARRGSAGRASVRAGAARRAGARQRRPRATPRGPTGPARDAVPAARLPPQPLRRARRRAAWAQPARAPGTVIISTSAVQVSCARGDTGQQGKRNARGHGRERRAGTRQRAAARAQRRRRGVSGALRRGERQLASGATAGGRAGAREPRPSPKATFGSARMRALAQPAGAHHPRRVAWRQRARDARQRAVACVASACAARVAPWHAVARARHAPPLICDDAHSSLRLW